MSRSIRRGYTSTEAVKYADDDARAVDGSALGPLFPWQLGSGFAHGRPWASLGSLEREVVPSGDPSIGYLRLTNSLSSVLYPVLIGAQLLEVVLRDHQLRGRSSTHDLSRGQPDGRGASTEHAAFVRQDAQLLDNGRSGDRQTS